MILLIFVRKGCCICDAIKNNLQNIDLEDIKSDLVIQEIDIDRVDLYQNKFKKYDYEVPVLAMKDILTDKFYELPRVSPRLKDSQLKNWLKKNITNFNNI